MKPIRYSELARADLREVLASSRERWGVQQTKRYMAAIRGAALKIRQTPYVGRRRDDIDDATRSVVAGRHLIFYEIHERFIFVQRVLHGNRDHPAHLSPDP